MGASDKIKKAVAGYFNDPKGTANLLGTTMSGHGLAVTTNPDAAMTRLKEKLDEEIKQKKELERLSKQIEITITAEGLRIELLEDRNGTFYESGSPRLSERGQELLSLPAKELKVLPNRLLIEGHTDATPYSNDLTYGNLGAFRGSGQRRAASSSAGRCTLRSGEPSARLRRSDAAREGECVRSRQPTNLDHGEEGGSRGDTHASVAQHRSEESHGPLAQQTPRSSQTP
jgi:hypothetical protein